MSTKNDSTRKPQTIKKEIFFLLLSLLLSFSMNIVGIAKHGAKWRELLTQIHVILILTLIIYFLIWLIRLLVILILRSVNKK